MKSLSRNMAVVLLVAALSGVAQAETSKGSSSSAAKNKAGATSTSKSKAKAKAKSSSSSADSDAPKPKAKAKPTTTDDDDVPAAKAKAKTKPAAAVDSEDGIDEPRKIDVPRPAAVTSINVDDLAGFDNYPRQVRSLVASAVALTHLGLTYTYGSSEPNKGGMDCSGTMYHVLRYQGLKDVPRQSDEMCGWVRDKTRLHLTPTATEFGDAEFAALRPGDLLFWTGTAQTSRKLPVTHVMLYLGKLKSNGKRVVFGSSDGRSYEGNRRCGVSVFDFSLPKPGGKAAFYGYGPAPGLASPEALALEEVRKAEAPPVEGAKPPLVDGEKMFAAKNAVVPEPLPQGETKTAGSAASPSVQASESIASKTPVADDGPEATTSGMKAPSSVTAARKSPASGSESTTQREDGVPGTPATSKNIGNGSGSKPATGSVAKTSSALPSSSRTTQRESSEAKAAAAKPKTPVASSTSKASSSGSGATRRESSTSKKSTASTTAQQPVARKKAPPEKTETKPEKVVREVVDTIRNAFK